MFLRLWTRAPCTAIVVRAAALPFPTCPELCGAGSEAAAADFLAFRFTYDPHRDCHFFSPLSLLCHLMENGTLSLFRGLLKIEKRQLLHFDVTLLRDADRCRRLADQPLVRQVLARRGHAFHIEVPFEMVLDLGA